MKKKILVATHGEDLDGRFSAELFKLAFPTEDIEFLYIPNTSNDIRFKYISKHKNDYSDIYIVDIGIRSDVPEAQIILNELLPEYTGKFHYIDHHKDALSLKEQLEVRFPEKVECIVKISNEVGKPISAAYLVCEKFKLDLYKNYNVDIHKLYKVIKAVNDWDTGTSSDYSNEFAKTLQLYYSAIPVEIAAEKIAESCLETNIITEDFTKLFIEGEEAYMDIYHQVVDFAKSSEIISSKLGRVLSVELPIWLKQEYKVPCFRDILLDRSLGIDFVILGDANVFRIYTEYEQFDTFELAKYIFKSDELISRSRTYYSVRKGEVCGYLGFEKDASWSDIITKVKNILRE